jgi:RND family efflux transporter MFP subunit
MSVAPVKGKKCVPFLALLAIVAAGCGDKNPKAVETPPPTVYVSHPLDRQVTDYQVFTARTQAKESVDIKARVTGYLTGITFKDGGEVKAGDLLFQIDDRPYKATLDQAKAALAVSKAALVKAQADYEIGQAVRAQSTGAISEQELTRRLGARDESKANVDQATAVLENALLNYNWCKVTAPISGRISRHLLDIGNLVSQDVTVLANIVSIKPTWAYFNVDQGTIETIQRLVLEGKIPSERKSAVPIEMALTMDKGFPYKGTLDFVGNQFDANTGSVRARAIFPNETGILEAGLFARVRVPVGARHDALLVTDRAIGTDQGQKFILVVNDKKEVEYRGVDVGQLFRGLREVPRFRTITETDAEGNDVNRQVEVLKKTDLVIVDGLQRVRPGAKVVPKEVDMEKFQTDAAANPNPAPAEGTKSKQ